MRELSDYTPEMLVYFHAMPPALQAVVRALPEQPSSMEALAAVAEQYAQAGMMDAQQAKETQ